MTTGPARNDPTEPRAVSYTMPDESAGFLLAERVAWHLLEKKGEDCVILDLRGRSDVCDFFVIVEGTSDIQVKALARHLQDALAEVEARPKSVEGLGEGRWVLLDFFDVVVHVFQGETRRYFQLERLWSDAGRLDVQPEWFSARDVAARHPDLKFVTAGTSDDKR